MVDITRVAPLASGAGAVTDTPEALQYQEALNQSMEALKQRMQPQTNLFNIAAGLLKPTRGGSFGESLGNANEVMGAEQERVEKEAIPIAQMRAQLAGQKYQMALEGKSQQALAQAVGGMDPQTISEALSSPLGAIGNPALMQRLSQAQMLAQPGTKAYEQIKTMLETQKNMIDLGIKSGQLTNDQARLFFETGYGKPPAQGVAAPAAGGATDAAQTKPAEGVMPIADLAKNLITDFGLKPEQLSLERSREQQESIYSRRGQPGIYTPVNPAEHPEQKVFHQGAIDVPQIVPPSYMESRGYVRPDPKGDPVHWVPRTAAAPAAATQPSAPAATQPKTEQPLSPKAQQELAVKTAESQLEREKAASMEREKERDVEFKPQRTTIIGFNPEVTDKVKRNNLELAKLATTNPEVFGFLKQEPGVLAALGTLVQEGVSIGNIGHVGLPVDKVYLATLPKESQNAYIRARQILAENFFANSLANKAAMPGSVSNFEEKLLQAPNASLEDTAQSIKDYAKRNLVMNEHRRELNREFKAWENKNPGSPLRSFFMHEDSPYGKVNAKWADMASQLTQGQ